MCSVTGCDGARRYDSRLVAADSLMCDLPDSALALVEAVGSDSLADEGDRAYRDLLLTQVSGSYDTIDVSSLTTGEYCITITSPTGHEFEGEFIIY